MRAFGLLLACIIVMMAASPAQAQLDIPTLEQRVTDFTNTLTYTEWNELQTRLKTFEDSTSTQIAILLVSSLSGQPIEDYSIKVFEKNKMGREGKDNGVLLVVAKEDRLVRIDVGYGLEGVLTDAVTSQIIEREIKAHFTKGDFYGGLSGGLDAIMAATAGEYQVDERGRAAPTIAVFMMLLFFALFFFLFLPALAGRRKYVVGSGGWVYHSGWGAGSRGWGGGSFGGGGFSGGGGMAGGGGATGRW